MKLRALMHFTDCLIMNSRYLSLMQIGMLHIRMV